MNRPLLAAAMILGSCSPAAPAAPAPPVRGTAPALQVSIEGSRLVDGERKVLQLRGVNLSGLETTAVQGWSPADPWGNAPVDFKVIRSWKANTVRIPLNEASWLGYPCTDGSGKQRDPDPGHNYRQTVRRSVADATRAGLYVILDLHWSAPAHFCPLAQAPMADVDNSPEFWRQVATEFKSQPGVIFELFNEPFMDWLAWGESPWKALRDGGTQKQFSTGTPGHWQAEFTWKSAGMQQLLDAVRSTGATNVVLSGGLGYSRDLSGWLASRPIDPLHQLGAVWHAYPKSMKPGTADAAIPLRGSLDYSQAEEILAAGFPVLVTEMGDHNAPGTVGAPFVSRLLPWADRLDISYVAWAWNATQSPDYVLLKDNAGTPSDGFGQYFQAHLACRALGAQPCP